MTTEITLHEAEVETPALLAIENMDGTLMVSSEVFAEGLGVQHKNLLETLNKHNEVIKRKFGTIAFETRKSAGRPIVVAHLTEDQALFVGTLSRNTERVVEFKATLVLSFSEARKRLSGESVPARLSAEQVLLQQAYAILENSTAIAQLRADVDKLMQGQTVKPPIVRQLTEPTESLRKAIRFQVNEYCGAHNVTQSETYNYLYKRLQQVYGINAYRLVKQSGESILDALERYGHLDKVKALISAELAYVEE